MYISKHKPDARSSWSLGLAGNNGRDVVTRSNNVEKCVSSEEDLRTSFNWQASYPAKAQKTLPPARLSVKFSSLTKRADEM